MLYHLRMDSSLGNSPARGARQSLGGHCSAQDTVWQLSEVLLSSAGAAHLLVVGFYRLTEDTGSLAVSASWLFYSVGVMGFRSYAKMRLRLSLQFVLAFAAGKHCSDAASAPTIVRIRVCC